VRMQLIFAVISSIIAKTRVNTLGKGRNTYVIAIGRFLGCVKPGFHCENRGGGVLDGGIDLLMWWWFVVDCDGCLETDYWLAKAL